MAGTESPNLIKPEPQNTSTENSNENARERNPPGGGNRGPRGRKGGTRFSSGRGGGMGGGNRNNDGPVRISYILFFYIPIFRNYALYTYRHICCKLMRNTFTGFLY